MVNFIFVGCDLHQETLVNRIAIGQGPSYRKVVANTRAGRASLIAYLKRESIKHGARVVFGYEASGQGFILHDQLVASGFECHVLAPTKMETSIKQKRNKNDDRDAERVLRCLRANKLAGEPLPSVWVPDPQTRDDREIVRARQDLGDKVSSLKTQVRCLLQRHGLEKPREVGKPWTKSHRQWLDQLCQDPRSGAGVRTALGSLMRQITQLEAEVRHLDEAVDQLSQKPHRKAIVDALDNEVGVGRLTATAYAVEVADFTRFRRGRQVGAYWGITPSSDESGKLDDRKGHITRQGSARIRKLLCQATWYRATKDPQVREVYQRMVSRNSKKKKIAVVACMRRLAVRLWHIGLQAQLAMEEQN